MTSHLFLPDTATQKLSDQAFWAVAHTRYLHVANGALRGVARDSTSTDHVFSIPMTEVTTLIFRDVGLSA